MKKLIYPLILSLLIGLEAFGQESVTIKMGEDLNETLLTRRYLFPKFQDARIYLKNESTTALMNYNALTDQMEFINDNGMAVALRTRPQMIMFGSRVFKPSPKGYVEVMVDDPNGEFLVRRKFKATSSTKTSIYGMSGETSALSGFSSPSLNNGIAFSLNEEVTYSNTNTYYIFTSGKYFLANKAGFIKAFGKQRPDLENYLKENPVNYNVEEDLFHLFSYCIKE